MSEEQITKEFPDELAVSADWETYYSTKEKYSLTTMPTWQYCADERFNPYLLAMCGKNIYDESVLGSGSWKEGETLTVFNGAGDMFRKLPDGRHLYVGDAERFTWWDKIDNRLIICHNASFDQVVFHECWKRGMLPRLKNVKWACTADLASYLMAPRNLKGAMKELLGLEISKEVRAAMDGRLPQHLNAEEYRALVEYGGADAIECHDLWLKYAHEWPYIERRISELNRESTMRGIKLNAEYVRASLKELESYLAVVACDIPWYPEKALGSLPALKKAVMEMGLVPPKSFKKDDPGFLRWQEQNGNIPFIKARQKAISISMCIARLKTMIETMDAEDRSHPAFLYFGSHTGRFSGRAESGGNMNLLNLPRKPVMYGDKNVFNGEGIDIRGSYIADPGRSFYIADYAQIEARMSLWLVDDTHMMEALKREGNLYDANAVAMGWCKSGANLKKNDPDLYKLSKAASLALGYQMGAVKFVETCKAQGLDLPSTPMNEWPELDRRLTFMLRSVAGVRGDFFAKENQFRVGQVINAIRVVDAWRRANHKIVDKWKELETIFKSRAIAGKETVAFRLPSGRVKRYWNPQLAKEPTVEVDEKGHEHPSFRIAMRASVTRGGAPTFFTGGTLLENIIQATARDLLMGAIAEACDKHPSWKYVFNVYDEVIIDVPTEEAALAEELVPKYMTAGDNIKWADGLMLAVEGGISQKYHK